MSRIAAARVLLSCWAIASSGGIDMADYAHPEVLVSTDWVAGRLNDPSIRIVEVDVDTAAYDQGHVPGAIAWAWNTQLADTVRRDVLSKASFEELMSSSGITPVASSS